MIGPTLPRPGSTTPVYSYSTGMQTRLGFSILTSLRPDILLLDENSGQQTQSSRNVPTSGSASSCLPPASSFSPARTISSAASATPPSGSTKGAYATGRAHKVLADYHASYAKPSAAATTPSLEGMYSHGSM